MLQRLILAVSVVALFVPTALAKPQKFASEDSATKFCKARYMVWFNPNSKIYFEPGSRNHGKKEGAFTCRDPANNEGQGQPRQRIAR
jgi:hypothetical protein